MAIKQDRSALPRSVDGQHLAPDSETRVLGPVLNRWFEEWLAEGDLPHAVAGTRFRASDSLSCSRAMAYKDAKIAETDPPTMADAWRMGAGTATHLLLDRIVVEVFPTAEVEVKVRIPDLDGSATLDLVIRDTVAALAPDMVGTTYLAESGEEIVRDADHSWIISLELKTVGGFAFKNQTMSFKGPAAGPKLGNVTQGALGACGVDADEMIVAYISMENISKQIADRNQLTDEQRFLAEWSFTRAEYEAIADEERKRVKWLHRTIDTKVAEHLGIEVDQLDPTLTMADDTVIDARQAVVVDIPRVVRIDDGRSVRITDPKTGAWVIRGEDRETILDHGTTWHCAYCRHRTRCRADG